MLAEALATLALALLIDAGLGEPRTHLHPTRLMGRAIARMTVFLNVALSGRRRAAGVIIVLATCAAAAAAALLLGAAAAALGAALGTALAFVGGALLLKTTFSIRLMAEHAAAAAAPLAAGNIKHARSALASVVKRDTSALDREHVISGIVESVAESTVDGILGPLFYYALFGLPGALVYRAVSTADSMIGYRTSLLRDIGWFAAVSDSALNYAPARLGALCMIASAALLGLDWRGAYAAVRAGHGATQSRNSGYPIAAVAGALRVRLEKAGEYSIGPHGAELDIRHVGDAVRMMYATTAVFAAAVVVPLLLAAWLLIYPVIA